MTNALWRDESGVSCYRVTKRRKENCAHDFSTPKTEDDFKVRSTASSSSPLPIWRRRLRRREMTVLPSGTAVRHCVVTTKRHVQGGWQQELPSNYTSTPDLFVRATINRSQSGIGMWVEDLPRCKSDSWWSIRLCIVLCMFVFFCVPLSICLHISLSPFRSLHFLFSLSQRLAISMSHFVLL